MAITQQIGPLLKDAYFQQNIPALQEWFSRFPDAYDVLTKEIGEAPLKVAMRDSLWLSCVFLLRQSNIPQKSLQVQAGIENTDEVCPLIVQTHVQRRGGEQQKLLQYLHDRVRI